MGYALLLLDFSKSQCQAKCQKIKQGALHAVCLGTCHGNFGASSGIEYAVCLRIILMLEYLKDMDLLKLLLQYVWHMMN